MKDFLLYIFEEVKNKRLDKKDAADLINQFESRLISNRSGLLHPLLNLVSTGFSEQSFISTFTGKEFFLANHFVRGRRILPGLIYLEMVQAAAKAIGKIPAGTCLLNMVWAKPIIIEDQPVQVHLELFPEDDGRIMYEVYRESEDGAGPVVHSQGCIAPSSIMEIPRLDLKTIQTQCTQSILSADEVYEALKMAGMDYDPVCHGIEAVYVGQDQILAKLSLPDFASETEAHFTLHPIMVDAALTSAGFMMGISNLKLLMPGALHELVIFNKCSAKMWALIRYSNFIPEGFAEIDKTKFDIELCDDRGAVCVRMIGYSPRALEGEAYPAEILMLKTGWKEQLTAPETQSLNYSQHLVVLCELGRLGTGELTPESIAGQMNGARCLSLQSKQKGIDKRFQSYSVQIFEEVQNILKDKSIGNALIQIVIPNQGESRTFCGLSGLLKTARLENPKLSEQIIEVDPDEDAVGIIAKLIENGNNPHDVHIRYQDGKQWVLGLSEVETGSAEAGVPWKDGGIYLITGGAGGLGRIFAGEIARQVKNAIIILTGRSPLSREKQAKLNELGEAGVKVRYHQLDVTDKKGITDLIQSVQEEFGGLNGIIHSAGVIHDNFIIKKTREEWREVLAAKVSGLVNLDLASRDLNLDFFVLFSSISGVFGNPGQADYSTANAFMNAYVTYRNNLVSLNRRQGRTIAINWPLWKEGGMRLDQESERLLTQNTGMIPMQTGTGIRAMYHAFASGQEQVIVMEGDPAKLKERILGTFSQAPLQPAKIVEPIINPEQFREKTLYQLKVLFGEVTGLEVTRIDSDEPLESYGIDSMMIFQLNPKLESVFGELSKTLFYEYQTLGELARYLTTEHLQVCLKWTGLEKSVPQLIQPGMEASAFLDIQYPVLASLRTKRKRRDTIRPNGQEPREPIAIIGLSGRYPRAKNIEAYWDNLTAGKDCITEIPSDRWSLEGFYHSNAEEAASMSKSYSKWGGFVEGCAEFDPLFFNISPREAFNMDPQERLFTESCWEVLEDAGYTREQLAEDYHGRVGVFAGITKTGFDLYAPELWRQGEQIFPHTSFSSVANRVSYLFNLQGPSMPIDTMCSSSLTAIHEACEHLYRGECEMAIAGGVNLYLHSSTYIALCGQQMLSKDGKCKSFGKDSNGFVPGEGVGAVLLKPLSRAIADGDQIYAVIRGTGINHGGKTNGYTVPNPKAQGELIRTVLEKAGINARTVSYIEAHGTGTELGDPIEITGLTQAFRKDTEDIGYCAIGSVKSNIGHLEAAAGIAGVTKIILQMKHRRLVPSLHAEELNPNINFIKTPFIVQQELAQWERPVATIDGETKEFPRIAGISSFGAGGSNAHIIIEEYPANQLEQPAPTITPKQPAIIILSAKNEERLKEQAERLIAVIRERELTDAYLADIGYTLQVGREAMEERLGVITNSIEELTGKLTAYIAGENGIADLYRGQVKRNQEALTVFTADDDLQKAVESWINKGKYGKLLDLWVKGLVFDWRRIYHENKPRRISLPTYPFAKELYWLPEISTKASDTASMVSAAIHPLLQQNTSDLSEQRYSSIFTGREFFLADHVVMGKRVLPGVAYLEMARAAVAEATGTLAKKQQMIKLKNVVWTRPIKVGEQPVQVHIGLYPEESGGIAYEVFTSTEAGEAGEMVYSQGSAALLEVKEKPVLDLPALQAECSQSSLSAAEIYEFFKVVGLNYGPGHQGIERLYAGNGRVLAKLSIPESVADTAERFVLHPSIMDGAFQAGIGLAEAEDAGKISPKPSLPFALQELEVYDHCSGSMWAFLQSGKSSTAAEKISKLDIDLCDDQGKVCVRMKGFTSRVLESGIGEATIDRVLLEPVWKEQAVSNTDAKKAPEYTQHIVVLCESADISPEKIKDELKEVRVFSLQSKEKDIAKRFQVDAVRIFEEIQKILETKPAGQVLMQLIYANQTERQLLAGLSGLLKTARLENPQIMGQLIEVETMKDQAGIIAKLSENRYRPMDNLIRYRKELRQIAEFDEIKVSEAVTIPWKDGGVYLITGGAGSLGRIFAKEIAVQAKKVKLILTGRSRYDDQQADFKELELNGAKVTYRAADVSDRNAVNELISYLRTEFGRLDGIIHSAGVIRDNYIIKKSKEEFTAVLSPKVVGLVNLDTATQDMNLDFIILFSSTSGSIGNPGQSDYATANAFMDAYAKYRNNLVDSGQRHGRTVSVNWPLWQEGGMRVDQTVEKMMKQNAGMIAMRTETGIRALYEGIATGREQIMVIEGELRPIRDTFLRRPATVKEIGSSSNQAKPGSTTVISRNQLQEKTGNYLKKLLSPVIKLPVERIEIDTPMEKYGIDSIMVMDLTNQLEKNFGSLSKTLFFEYQTIRELSGYFLENYYEKLNESMVITTEDAIPTDTGRPAENSPAIPIDRSYRRTRFGLQFMNQDGKSNRPLDIAVIGMSGRYPQARNLEDFWRNLRDGKDCITEIPKERWEHSQYYDEDKNKFGKTYSKWGGFLEGVDQFDPLFFNISPREAEYMDPQERLFLECVYETLEDAGYTRETLSRYQGLGLEGNVGVYVGVMYEEYQLYGAQAQVQGNPIALSGNPSSIANRVSYFCNFHGPSVALDTMCSSSLTAIHIACQSIQREGCELAIAGGVNVSIHLNKYLMLGQGKFVSSKGRCESFGLGGDGYVPGEGVGAVLLKSLSKAIADGDHIYGVIKGTAINHGGKTNGYTVPNPNAQAGVIEQALQEAGVDHRTISYIEAHGTGTSLGDPIEITGLVKIFQKHTGNKQFCAIGSAKSNIGHCESAAGIAGVTKVLLQIKNRQIAPSLHSGILNPNIDFSNTPFVVQQELAEWERPVLTIDGVTQEYPRIAGISSFGAGGSNAHVVIEEYIPGVWKEGSIDQVWSRNPAIIILSAKDSGRLKEQAQRLLTEIRERQFTDADLANMAYTLQIGREAMEERLGIIVGSMEELAGKLAAFSNGKESMEDLYYGQVNRNQESLTIFTVDEEMQEAFQKWIERKKYGKLVELWVKGLVFDWNKLYGDRKPHRISLPTYPFAKERYWVPEIDIKRTLVPNKGITTYIHPLLQQNTSNFTEQRYSSIFTGEEFFLADHMVNGQKVLPGVAYLEMARAAVKAAATDSLVNDRMMIEFKNVVWARPVMVGEQPVQLHIGLHPEDHAFSENGSGEINYEIYEATGTEDGMPLVYSQGKAILTMAPELPVLDLQAVQAECGEIILPAAEVYEAYRAMGIDYGPGHRGIAEIHLGPELVLARLSLPSTVAETQEQFVLHPSIMDAALQASIGLETSFKDRYLTESKGVKPMLPFALEELEIIEGCSSSMWAVIRYSEGSNAVRAGEDKIQKLDIDVCDEEGHICVRLKGFSSRILETEIPVATGRQQVPVENTPEFQAGTIMLAPAWEKISMKRVETPSVLSERVVIIGGTKEQKSNIQKQYPNASVLEIQTSDSIDEIAGKLTENGTINQLLWIAPNHKSKSFTDEILIKEQNRGVLQVFKIIKGLLKLGYGTRELSWSLITNRTQAVRNTDAVNPTHASLSGLVGSMAKEYPNWNIRLMDLETEVWPDLSDIFTLPADTSGNGLAFRDGEWYGQQLIPVQSIPIKETLYKTGGVYVVIGGAGGIGEAWSEYVIRTYQAQVIWIGRRAKDEFIQAKMDRLAGFGPEPQYIAADATKRQALEEAYREIKQRYRQINGVIHSAIVLLDKSLMNMTEEQFQAALSAKVDVSVRMAQVFSEESLDFVMFFSSMESFSKSAGQSNYAAGCTFNDAFAQRLNLEWPGKAKVMNWGYWGNVGIVASEVYQERMAQAGIGSIEPPEAMDALERLLAGPINQIALMKTIKPLTIEGTNPEKQISIYPESLPSVIGNMDNHLLISD